MSRMGATGGLQSVIIAAPEAEIPGERNGRREEKAPTTREGTCRVSNIF